MFIATFLHQGMIGNLVWTAMRMNPSYTFVIRDNEPVKYTNWGKGHPKERVFGDCVVTWRGAMYRHDCNRPAQYVCEQEE
jgi:hypothetical protein